ncbi:MAG: glycyl-radical enzyme activating protein [Clostridiales bacterium]|nr:glycyl-radical enzyme activating protein [Clostridiales bacterium]
MTLNVSNIQHFSTGDGDGIRTTVFLKGCNLRCPWCHNPETISPKPQILNFKAVNEQIAYGKSMTVDEIVADITKDELFYDESGGGVTISGGEAMLQSDGCAALSKELQKKDISVIMDTAGCVPFGEFEKVRPFVDKFYYDFKTPDKEKYEKVIKGNFDLIQSNLEKLIRLGSSVNVRIPLIPGFNTSNEDIEKFKALLLSLKVKEIDLLPFHRLGASKYEAMGKQYLYRDTPVLSKNEINSIFDAFSQNFSVRIET